MIKLRINGEERIIEPGMTVADYLQSLHLHSRMVVVEHNFEIIPRDSYGDTVLKEGDNLEIVQMMAGG
jgi:thiamine biosynthesis protein ThiS